MALTKARNRMIEGSAPNAADYGAVGDGIEIDTLAIQSAISSTYGNDASTGDTVELGRGVYKTDATISIDNSAQTYDVDNITLQGAGRQSTIIDASASTSGPAVKLTHSIFNNISDLTVSNATTSGINIDAVGNTSPGQRTNFERTQVKGSGTSGFDFERSYLCNVSQCNSEENAVNGFHHNWQIHTSWLLQNNYGRQNGTPDPLAPTFHTGAGFRSDFNVYSAYVANASDENRYGYHILGNRGVSFISNGAEFNARSGFLFETRNDAADPSLRFEANWVTGMGNTCGDNNKANDGYANHSHVLASDITTNFVVQKQPVSFACSVANTFDFIADGRGAKLVLEDPLMQNDGTRAYNDGHIQVNYTAPKLVYSKTFTALTAEVLTQLDTQLGTANDFSGEILVTAHNSAFGTAGVIGTATYKLLVSNSLAGYQLVEIAKLGLITGASSSHPSFTFTLSASGLVATPVSTTAGSFWFSIEKIGGNFTFA